MHTPFGERISAAALESMDFDSVDLPGPYGDVLGPIGPAMYLLVWGMRGSGKSTFCAGLAAGWAAAHGPAEIVAIEEGPGPALQDKIARLGIGRPDLGIRQTSDLEELMALASETSLVVVDSISEAGMDTDEVARLKQAYKAQGTALVVVAHALKTGADYKGPSEWGHGVGVELQVYEDEEGRNVAETKKNRFAELRTAEVPMTSGEMPSEITDAPRPDEEELKAEREAFKEARENRSMGAEEILEESEQMEEELSGRENSGADTPAPPSDQIEGSDQNESGSAAEPNDELDLGESIESMVETRAEEHNETGPQFEATTAQLKSVARRAMGAYSTSHRPGVTRQGWASGRIDAFLEVLSDPSAREDYVQDHDLLPPGHPRSTRENAAERPALEDVIVGRRDVVTSDAGDYQEKYDTAKRYSVPTKAQDAAAQAIEWMEAGHGGGTGVAVRRAMQLANGFKLSAAELHDILDWFKRKEHERKFHNTSAAVKGEEAPTPALVSWYAWGAEKMWGFAEEKVGRENPTGEGVTRSDLDGMGVEKSAAANTQTKSTRPTYERLAESLPPGDHKVLDYGAGRGHGAEYLREQGHEVETLEPFPEELDPTYTDPSDVPSGEYDAVFAVNVLNVMPSGERASAIDSMLDAAGDSGTVLVSVRSSQGVKELEDGPAERVNPAYVTTAGTFQKGYEAGELVEELESRGAKAEAVPGPGRCAIVHPTRENPMRTNRVATLSEQEIEDRLESARDELRKIRGRYDRKLKEVAGDFSELVQMPGVDPQARIDEIRDNREAELATQRRHVERLEKAAEEARRERESQTDLFGARENRSMGAEEILQESEEIRKELEERENPYDVAVHNGLFGDEHGRIEGTRENPAEELNARERPLPDELRDGQRKTYKANIDKLNDGGTPPPTRLEEAWEGLNVEFAFELENWHMNPDRTAQRFGLRGVQFGRWMEADMRVFFLAKAAQGLEEFRQIAGTSPKEIPPQAIGNGELTLALGARGQGGQAVAHYEASTKAINVTKTKGPGSLAHEMGHALDHRVAELHGLPQTFATDRGGPGRSVGKGVVRNLVVTGDRAPGMAEETFARLVYRDVPAVSDISASGPAMLSDELELRRWAADLYEVGDEYRTRRIEIFARAFEMWVQREVAGRFDGRLNRMLTKSGKLYERAKQYPSTDAIQAASGPMKELTRRALLNGDVSGPASGAVQGEDVEEETGEDEEDRSELTLREYFDVLKDPDRRDEEVTRFVGRYKFRRLAQIAQALSTVSPSTLPGYYSVDKLEEITTKLERAHGQWVEENEGSPERWAKSARGKGPAETVTAVAEGMTGKGSMTSLDLVTNMSDPFAFEAPTFEVDSLSGPMGRQTWKLEGPALDVVTALLLTHHRVKAGKAEGERFPYTERCTLKHAGDSEIVLDNGGTGGGPYSSWERSEEAAKAIEEGLKEFADARENPRRNRIETLERKLDGAAQLQDILPEGRAMIHLNDQNGGIEVYFPGQQPEETTERLKEAGFWYDPATKGGLNYWWAEQTPERMELAKELAADPDALKVGEGEEVQGLGRSDEVEVFDVPISDVNTDPDRFQPRGGDYSEKTASRIVEDFDPELMDPIDLWRDPEDGELYVLAGHSRLEGFKRRGDKDTIPAEVLDVSEEDAIKYALIENESGTDLTPSERAGVLNDIVEAEEIDTISGRKEKAKDLFGKSGNEVFALSYLDPSGPLMQTLRQFEGSGSTEADDVLQMAKWVGKIRRFNRKLSDLHERNLWDYLQDNFKTQGRKFTSFIGFREYVEETLQRQFFGEEIDPETPLNLDRVDPKSDQEEKIDKMLEEKKEELREARRELRKKREELIERGAEGEDLDRALKPFEQEVNATQQELVEMKQRAQRERGRLKEQEQGLFAGARGNRSGTAPQWVHFGRTAGLDVELTDGRTMEIRMDSEGGGHLFTAVEMNQLILVESPLVKVAAPAEGDEAERAFEEFHRFDPEERPGGEQDYIFEIPGGEAELVGEAKTLYYRSDKVMRAGDEPGEMHSYYHHFDGGHPVEKVSGTGGVYAVGSCLGDILPSGFRCKEIEVDERGILN